MQRQPAGKVQGPRPTQRNAQVPVKRELGSTPPQPSSSRPPMPTSSARPNTSRAETGIKRSGAPEDVAIGSSAKKVTAALRVYTKSENDEIGIQTLVGDYQEKGINHGRKFYQKMNKIVGHEDVQVFLYYWDTRDGAEFTGWWFGDRVGSTQVWSRASAHGPNPPQTGWRIPWDGQVQKDLLIVEPVGAAKPQPTPAVAIKSEPRSSNNRVQQASSQIDTTEAETEHAIQSLNEMVESEGANEENIKEAERVLKVQQANVVKAQKVLATQINDARVSGEPPQTVAELSKLSPRLRALQARLIEELGRTKGELGKAQKIAEEKQRKLDADQKQAQNEQRDAKALQDTLSQAMDLVTQAEDAVDTVAIIAAPFNIDDELGESAKKTIDDIEEAANKASTALAEARRIVSAKFVESKNYAPEAQKMAKQEFTALQGKLTEAGKRLNPFKKFRQEYEQKAAAKQALEEITAKLSTAELEVEKAHIMISAGLHGQMAEDDIRSAEELLSPAQSGIKSSLGLIERRARHADGPLKRDLDEMRQRAQQSQDKLEEVRTVLHKQREGLSAQHMLSTAHEKVEKAEEVLLSTSEAEMPFLKGVEVLPQNEAMQAIEESEAAAKGTQMAVDQAKHFLKTKLSDVKSRYSKDVSKKLTDELSNLQTRVDTVANKLTEFKKHTAERKTKALLQEVVGKVTKAETRVQALAKAAQIFSAEKLEEVSAEALKTAGDQASVAEKDASTACSEARKLLGAKQKDANEPSLVAELTNLQRRLSAAHQDLSKHKKMLSMGDRMIKNKQTLLDEEEKLKQVEIEVGNAETLASPLGNEGIKDDDITKIDAGVSSAQSSLASVVKSMDSEMQNALAPLKAALSKLLSRAKKFQERLDKVKMATREQREQISSGLFIKEAQNKASEVEAASEKLNEAELPFLKGIEVLPRKEATALITDSEAAGEIVQKAISAARTFIASKTLEARRFMESISKPTSEALQTQTERINAVAQKLGQFKKDTETRKRTALMQEASEKLTAVEAEVEKTTQAACSLSAEESLSAEAATEICENLAALGKSAQSKMEQARSFLAERQRDVKGHAAHEEQLKQLQSRLSNIQVEFAKVKKSTSESEQRFVAKKVVSEAADLVRDVEGEVETATQSAAPLLDDGGLSFLVANNVLATVEALRDHMAENSGVTKRSIFEHMAGKDGKVSLTAFQAYLETLPELLGREDLTFTEEQRTAIFKHVDIDKNGELSHGEFEAMFLERFMCVQAVSVTDALEISKAKKIAKLELDDVVEAISEPKTNEKLTRIQCRMVDGKEGWVTTKGNQGTVFLEAFSPYTSFVKTLDRVLDVTSKSATKASSFVKQKSAELAQCSQGPLAEARDELSKLRPKVGSIQKKLEDLRQKVATAKKEFSRREQSERNAQKEVRDRKTAAAILKAINEKVDVMEASAAKLNDTLNSFISLEGPSLEAFATPISTSEAAKNLLATVETDVKAARDCLAEHQCNVAKAAKGPLHEAKQAMSKILAKLDSTEKKNKSSMEAVRTACTKIASARLIQMASALRSDVQNRKITLDALFSEMAGENTDTISEDAFRKHLEGLPDLNMTSEHVSLLFKHIGDGGIPRRSLLKILQQYYVCIKQISITDEFQISKSKTQRMLEVDEIVEVLEGPKGDDKLGVTRIRGKALSDATIGWISVKGNHGTPFLKDASKPFYECMVETSLEKEFQSNSSEVLRVMKREDVIEVLEGPRKDKHGEAVRGKATVYPDGSQGWFTLKDREGISSAEKESGRYYVCTISIAVTDSQDISKCKVIRKLQVGEVVKVLEAPILEKETGVSRMRCQSLKDQTSGWVTVKGNAGTTYAEESTKHYTVVRDVPLQKTFSSDCAEVLRRLAKGETIELLDERGEKFDAVMRVKGRALSDGAVGWTTLRDKSYRPWSAKYRCTTQTVIHESLTVKNAQVLRRLETGEVVELVEGPMEAPDLGVMRIRGRAEKDGTLGWITIRGNQGTVYLTSRTK